ncbi:MULTISPECIES: sugar MFS transporter [unclassified Vagococcus]|uniref:MFS transporter n=1 Tax=unclassified Vagococcus TaxID=2648499 RepID=UPI001F50A35F|nr:MULTISPECIES: MFS transporter [unclassified Vagococcus]MCI0130991.1 MFS transporter [Vagococcus sp. CY53-2]UNM89434.1 MFS transporter [Vagococcus sp. CY52-2]
MSFYKQLNAVDKYILWCCFFIFFVNGLYSMVFGSILPLLSDAYSVNETVSGMLLSSHQAGNLIAGFVAGILPLYYGRKKSILFLSSFVIIGFLLIIGVGTPWILLFAFFFTGISRGSISNFNNKTVNDITDSNPSALNFLHSLFAIGALLSPFLVMLFGQLFGLNGWRWLLVGIIGLIVVSQMMFFNMPIEGDSLAKDQTTKEKDYTFFKDSLFWNTIIIIFFYLCAESAITGWLVTYFIQSDLLTIQQSQMISSLLWVGILIGRLGCVFSGSRLSRGTLITLISIGSAIFYGLLLASNSITMILVSVLGLGISMGGIYPTAMTIAGSSIKKHPMSLGWILVIGGLGGITMPIVTGYLAQTFTIFWGMVAIILAIFMMLLGVFWYQFVNQRKEEI